MALVSWKITWPGELGQPDETYEWSNDKLTVGNLRHFKQWFGPDYGRVAPFNLMFAQGDADAIACVIWALRKEGGKNPPEPRNMPDFSVGNVWEQIITEADTDDAADPPTEQAADTSTSD